MLIIAQFRGLSIFFLNFEKVFRFGNSCALCARLPRQLRVRAWVRPSARVGVCYARIKVRASLGGGFWCACNPFFWGRFLPPFWVGFRLVFWVWVGVRLVGFWWWGFGGWCVGKVGERERQRRTGKGERAQGRTNYHKRRKRERVNGLPVWAVFVRPSDIIFLTLIISRLWWGYFTPKRQPKNGEQYVSAHSHSHEHFSEHRTHPFGRRFRKPSQ